MIKRCPFCGKRRTLICVENRKQVNGLIYPIYKVVCSQCPMTSSCNEVMAEIQGNLRAEGLIIGFLKIHFPFLLNPEEIATAFMKDIHPNSEIKEALIKEFGA